MKLLVINGPNLNLLGLREPAIYGSQNYEALLALIRTACDAEGIEVGFVQSNHEASTAADTVARWIGIVGDTLKRYSGILWPANRTVPTIPPSLDCVRTLIVVSARTFCRVIA